MQTPETGATRWGKAAHASAGSSAARSQAARNPFLFVVGCPRSGTTLLQRMLDHHPQLAVANDTHFIPRCLELLGPNAVTMAAGGRDIELTEHIVDLVKNYHRFHRLGISDADFEQAASSARTYGEFVRRLYDAFCQARGKSLAGEKTPDYVRHLPLLSALFPWIQVVHIVRDGRDVALSARDWAKENKGPGRFKLWKTEPVAVCALWWQWLVRAGHEDGLGLGERAYMVVRYETLVHRPAETMRRVTAFLRLPFVPVMLRYHEGKSRSTPGISAKSAWLPPTPGLRDWQCQMNARDVELFEALAGDLLTQLGYQRAVDTISPQIADLADSYRAQWEAEMRPIRLLFR